MDNSKWERAVMHGQSVANTCQWFPRPKLEIPNIEPATPRRRGGIVSAQSPQGIYDFPISPQSPGEGMMLSPPMKQTHMKTMNRPCVQDSMDQVPKCTQFSPGSNHPGHGFGDCNAQCNSNKSNFCHKSPIPLYSPRSIQSTHGFNDNAECSNNRSNLCQRSPISQYSPGSNHTSHSFSEYNVECSNNRPNLYQRAHVSQYSPRSNHHGHGFSDCNADCSSNISNLCQEPLLPTSLYYGENVLVRCNQTKWLVGQVRRITNTNIKVWIGMANTLVNVPVELFPTHLARLQCPTPFSTPRDFPKAGFPEQNEIRNRIQCVRPSHLSHRHLFQRISPSGSLTNSPRMQHAQCTSPAPKDPRTMYTKYGHCHPPTLTPSPPNLPELVATCFEKKEPTIPQPPSILKCSELLFKVREESKPLGVIFDAHEEFFDLQAQHDWKENVAQSNQQESRPSYPRPAALPLLNVNLNNESTQTSDLPFLCSHCHSCLNNTSTPISSGLEHMYNNNSKSPTCPSSEEDFLELPLNKPKYEQFGSTQFMMKNNTMDLGDKESSKRPPTPSNNYIKGKAVCVDETCSSWAKGIEFPKISEINQGKYLPLERSISLDSFQPSYFSGLEDPRSPGARPPKNATQSAEPVWVTVIDNKFGHGPRKL